MPNKPLRYIDLFAGIGGMRIPFDELGCKCVFSSEWDEDAKKMYSANFGEFPARADRKPSIGRTSITEGKSRQVTERLNIVHHRARIGNYRAGTVLPALTGSSDSTSERIPRSAANTDL